MKRIGYQNRNDDHWSASDFPAPLSVDLYTTDPDTRENVNAEHYECIGWILVGDTANGGGKVYETREAAGTNSMAAYVRRTTPTKPQRDLAAEIDALTATANAQHETVLKMAGVIARHEEWIKASSETFRAHGMKLAYHASVIDTVRGHRLGPNVKPSEPAMTFYDHAFIAAYMFGLSRDQKEPIALALDQAHTIAAMLTDHRRPTEQTPDRPASDA